MYTNFCLAKSKQIDTHNPQTMKNLKVTLQQTRVMLVKNQQLERIKQAE